MEIAHLIVDQLRHRGKNLLHPVSLWIFNYSFYSDVLARLIPNEYFFLGTSFDSKAKLLYINDIQLLGLLLWLLSISMHSQSVPSFTFVNLISYVFRAIDWVNDYVLCIFISFSNVSCISFVRLWRYCTYQS